MPTIDIVKLDENPHETVNGLRADTVSRGVDLQGATIRATYADGTTETLTWVPFDSYTYGGANGENISARYGYDWHELSANKLLVSLEIDLQPSSSVFDVNPDYSDYPAGNSTPGSHNGFPFELDDEFSNISGSLTVTYSGIVNIRGADAVGDLYTTMRVDFSGLSGGGFLGDLRWRSDIDTLEVPGDLLPTGAPCLTRGTLVTTDCGDLPVEDLKSGCKVLTKDHGFQELIFSLSRVVDKTTLQKNEKLNPVRITAGALGGGLPKKDLLVSRQHRIAVRSDIGKRMFGSETVLIAAIRLVDLPGIYIDDSVDFVEYFHLIFKRHEVIFAEGAATESFLMNFESKNKLTKLQRKEMAVIFPEFFEEGYVGGSSYMIPSGMQQKELVRQHLESAETLLSA